MDDKLHIITADDPQNRLHDPSRSHESIAFHEEKACTLSRALYYMLLAEMRVEFTDVDREAVRSLSDEVAHHTSVLRFLRQEEEQLKMRRSK